jgi:hypothetical protein
MLNHVLEEELCHLLQKTAGRTSEFSPGLARELEEEINEQRRFPLPAH